jgi:hypothetical protein
MLLKKQGGGLIRAAPLLYVEGVETGGLTARWEINVYGFIISSRQPVRSCSSATIFPPEGKFKLRTHPQGYCDFLLMTKSMTPAGSGAAPAVSDGTGGGWLIAGARVGAGAGGSAGFWAFTSWSWD